MNIFKMTRQDIDQVLEIEKENFDEPWPTEAFVNDIESDNDREAFVLKDNDEVIGYYNIWYMFEEADLANIVVKKEYQGRRLGELLLNHCVERCKIRKVQLLHLEVKVDNIKALNLYKKFGFKEVRIRKGYYAGVDGIDMVKEI